MAVVVRRVENVVGGRRDRESELLRPGAANDQEKRKRERDRVSHGKKNIYS